MSRPESLIDLDEQYLAEHASFDPVTSVRQPSLLDDTPGLVRRDHRDTAKHAASLAKTGSIRFEVLALIAASGVYGYTDEELAANLDRSENTVRPRRVECVRDGWVTPATETRRSQWGREMTVWCVTQAGMVALREALDARAKR